MCGIAGMMAFTKEGEQWLSRTSTATYSLISRGPDDEGLFFDGRVSLGHRRLAIIDTSNKAHQPMSDASKRYTLVFNGEIFNFPILKKGLEKKGIVFHSSSDTEVLLQLFILEKEKCLKKLEGEFAFAIYDRQEQSVFLARDRYGIKPLYFIADKDKILFASEMKALLAFGIPKEIDYAALRTFFQLNYIPAPATIFKNVQKFPSAGFAKISNRDFQVENYYKTEITPSKTPSYEKVLSELHRLLEQSVQDRLVADVPLGCFLSGGVDSSVIALLASKHKTDLKTFSIGYKDEKFFDETNYAKVVAKKLKTDHTVFSLSNEDLFSNLYRALDYTDEPFADSSALAVHILSMHTRKQVKVALSGDGADELFGGYHKHKAELKARKGGVVESIAKSSGILLKNFSGSRNSKIGNQIRKLKKFSKGASMSASDRYWQWAGFADEMETEALLVSGSDKEFLKRKKEILKHIDDDFNSVLFTDVNLVLQNDMLVKVDRMSMANSLELRVPFLCHHVVDFAFSLPSHFKMDGQTGKKILKDAFRKELPAEILSRKKQGFEVPLLKWFRTELRSLIENELLEKKFIEQQGLFHYSEVEKIKNHLFSSQPGDTVARIWALIVFQYWWKKNMS